jgi:hypothetical protein
MKWLVAFVAFTGCVSAVKRTNLSPELHSVQFCFAAQVKGERMVGCSPSYDLCWRANNTARKYGSLAGVSSIGECSLVTFPPRLKIP